MTDRKQTTSEEVMIGLKELCKRFPGHDVPAVDNLSLDIHSGEIVVFVGPSGCGKTTTMKMINRLIEPTSGRIFLEGEDVSHVNPDQLRRRIGYVIQQIGLFPHMTIADNIAVVPRLLGWDKARIDRRVDELLDLIGIPLEYGRRYPKALSGGQKQRVGVARAMAADPPVLLMDEPFGAIDPITRERLQNEFLRLQERIRKTIVFVSHDIDEAVKMGDRIAVFGERSRIIQYDTPERILTSPANDFVRNLTGSGAMLKRLALSRVCDIGLREVTDTAGVQPSDTILRDATLRDALDKMLTSDSERLVVVDHEDSPCGMLDFTDMRHALRTLTMHSRYEPCDAGGIS
jgi:osmoprotectant transport system ATP-binding protein